MSKNELCQKCGRGCEDPCMALKFLFKLYKEKRAEEKRAIIAKFRSALDIIDFERQRIFVYLLRQ